MRFKINDIVSFKGETITILDKLGEGGQGEVYLVSYQNKNYAFKFYKNKVSSDFRYNLKNNIDRGRPSEDFLWPFKLIDLEDGHLGYLMELRPSTYTSFISYLNGRTIFKNQSILIRWCIELCIAFKKLHEKGFSYQDLNDGSFFLNPMTGDLLICDNDNVTADKKNLGILGKMRYMAPEVVMGKTLPDIHSDRFSLAIILFLALCMGNPFEGECLKKYDIIDNDAEKEMFGTNPIFIYHKTNTSNRPIRGYHTSVLKRWEYLPQYIKDAFHRTFVDGLAERENERTTELEWIKLLAAYRDELITCGCGKQYIYGFKEKKVFSVCPYCNVKTRETVYLHIGKNKIILEPQKIIYHYHLDKYSSLYNESIGEVIQNKNNPLLWGIRMRIANSIELRDNVGNIKTIDGNGVIPIIKNLKIKFNDTTTGEIE